MRSTIALSGTIAAVAVMAILITSGLMPEATAHSAAPSPPAPLSPLAVYGQKAGQAAETTAVVIAHYRHISPSQLNTTLQGVLELYGSGPAARLASEGTTILEGCGSTAIAGGIIGGVFGGLPGLIGGAIAGCIIGAINAQLSYQAGLTAAQKAFDSVPYQWLASENGAMWNEWNITEGLTKEIYSALNLTRNAMAGWAEAAALSQLGNATFNATLDISQTPIPYDFLVPQMEAYYTYGSIINATSTWAWAKFGPGGEFASDLATPNPAITGLSSTGGPGISQTAYPFYASFPALYVVHGAPVFIGTALNQSDVSGELSWDTALQGGQPLTYTGDEGWNSFPGPTGLYTGDNAGGWVYPMSDNSGSTQGAANTLFAQFKSSPQYGWWGTSQDDEPSVAVQFVAGYLNYGFGGVGCTTTCYKGPSTSPGAYTNVLGWPPNWENGPVVSSANSADVYWQYLRSLGYTSASQIPAQCIIPTPSMALPPNVDLGNLTIQDWEAMYYSWAEGLAQYYGTNLSDISNFCANHGPHYSFQWLGNLTVNATASIYIANSTEYPSENLSNLSTWAYQQDQVMFWPELTTIAPGVGHAWEVEKNDPVEAVVNAPGNLTFLTLTGQGSCWTYVPNGSACPQSPSTPGPSARLLSVGNGDYLYIWSCTVNGQPSTTCEVQDNNVVYQSYNITCPSGDGNCVPPPPSGGGAFTIPNPFASLESWLSSLFGGGLIGGLASSLLTALVVVALVLIAIYAVFVAVRSAGSRRGGSGGSQIFIGGGR